MSREEWVTICNVRTLADHYEAIAAGKKDSYACNPGEIADALRSAADMLERLPRWISVDDRLPEVGVSVLVMTKHGMHVADLDKGWSWNASHGDSWEFPIPTHWMPLPEPPEVK